jgi:hypothetical protein
MPIKQKMTFSFLDAQCFSKSLFILVLFLITMLREKSSVVYNLLCKFLKGIKKGAFPLKGFVDKNTKRKEKHP